MNITVKTKDRTFSLVPSVELYLVRDSIGRTWPGLAIELHDAAENEPFGVLTVSFGEFISLKNAAYIDSNNMPLEVLSACLAAGIAKETPLTKSASFGRSYPLWIFDECFLRNVGGDNYVSYERGYRKCMKSI